MIPDQRLILCVDDDPDDQLMVRETINQIDPYAHVITAINGQQALQYLAEADPHEMPCLIIMDINMPVLDGKTAVARLKREPLFENIPVVMFTTSSSLLDRTFCDQYDIPFVTKPLNQKDLVFQIKNILTYCKAS